MTIQTFGEFTHGLLALKGEEKGGERERKRSREEKKRTLERKRVE